MTLRQRSGPIITIIVWVFCTALLADAAIRGSWETVRTFLPPLTLACWVAFAVLWRPALVVGPDRVTVRDVLRTTVIPFRRVTDVRLGPTVTISAQDPAGREHTYRPWNAPGRSQHRADRQLRSSVDADPLLSHPSYGLLRAWRNHPGTRSAEAEANRANTRPEAPDGAAADSRAKEGAGTEEIASSWNIAVLAVTPLLVLLVLLDRL